MILLSNKHAAARTPEGFAAAVKKIDCEPAALNAVFTVEAGGRGYDKFGRLKALFEPHVFYRVLSKFAPDKLETAIAQGLAYPKWGERGYPKDSYPRIEAARQIDEELAYRAVSWGLPQILGENFKAAGYNSAIDMVTAFLSSEDEQLDAVADFIIHNKLAAALRDKDWATFARGYNGAGYAKNAYDKKLATAYRNAKLNSTLSTAGGVIVATGTSGATASQATTGDVDVTIVIIIATLIIAAGLYLWTKFRNRVDDSAVFTPTSDPHAAAPTPPAQVANDFVAALNKVRERNALLKEAVTEFNEVRSKMGAHIEAMRTADAAASNEVAAISAAAELTPT